MDSRHWTRLERIFHEAMELAAERRDAFLGEACGDDVALRERIDTLIRCAGATGGPASDFFRRAAASTEILDPVRSTAAGPSTGSLVSHYRLEERLGAGGMGEVYRAQDLALGREAAVKLLSPGMADALRDRLVQEARTSARAQACVVGETDQNSS